MLRTKMVTKNQEPSLFTEIADDLAVSNVAVPLLTTKLYRPPVTPQTERRTRLIEHLELRKQRPLTLICAPAGYGKTVLASLWLETSGLPYGWVSLDDGDDNLPTFISYLLAAIYQAFPTLKLKTQPLLGTPTIPSVPVLARYLLNDLDKIQEPFILVLDDLHRIREPSIYQLLDELLQHPLPALHLVLIGRHEPPLQLSSLRAHSQMTEIRAGDLRFTVQETTELLSQMLGRQVDERVAADWASTTEGWVTAIRLAALSLRHRNHVHKLQINIQGDNRYLQDYLLAEVLARLPVANQAWLLKSACLDRFCAALIEAVCRGDKDSEQLTGQNFIDWLERENLFLVPLDDRGKWFRYHHLFQELLQGMLRSQLSSDEFSALYRRASTWFAENNLIDEALKYALLGRDVESAVHLVEQHRYELINADQWIRLERWLKLLPENVVTQNPLVMSAKGILALHQGLETVMFSCLQLAEEALKNSNLGPEEYQNLLGELDTIHSVINLMIGKPVQSFERAQSSLERLPDNAMQFRLLANAEKAASLQMQGDLKTGVAVIRDALSAHAWSEGLQAKMMHYLSIVLFQEGDLKGVLEAARIGQRLSEKNQKLETLCWSRYHLGVVHYLRNELEQAELTLQAFLEDRATSAPNYLGFGCLALISLYLAKDPIKYADRIEQIIENYFPGTNDLPSSSYGDALKVEIALRQGNLAEARHLSNKVDFDRVPPIWLFYAPQLTPIKLLLAGGEPEQLNEAHARCEALGDAMSKIHRNNVLVDVLALHALVCAARGDESTALEKLDAALDLGIKGGNIRSFVDLGYPMANLLHRLNGNGAGKEYAEYIEHILAAFPNEVRATQAFEPAPISTATKLAKVPSTELLTSREFQVLKLLATDLSPKEIAGRLVISPGTLHVHIKNIYRKLDVHKRAEAVQIAKKFRFL